MNKNDQENLILEENSLFMSSVRFPIMLILVRNKMIVFSELQKLLSLSSGKLTHHLTKLAEAGYIELRKSIFPSRPLTVIRITNQGKKDFIEHINQLKTVLNKLD